MRFPLSDSVSKHMHPDFAWVSSAHTVAEALEWIRAHPPGGGIVYFYVMDEKQHLCGVLSSRQLLLEPPLTPVASIMRRALITVGPTTTLKEASRAFLQHRLLGLPVIEDDGRMLGVIDMSTLMDDIPDVDEPTRQQELFQRLGLTLEASKTPSPLRAFRLRFPWLLCNITAGLLAAFMSGVFEEELSRVVALTFFIPVVLNLAESVSSQSVSLTLEYLRGELPSWQTMRRTARREGATGFFLGIGASVIIAAVSLMWLGHGRVALTLFAGVALGVTFSAVCGVLVPFGLKILRLEPQVAAGPVVLATADVVTLLIYLNLARLIV